MVMRSLVELRNMFLYDRYVELAPCGDIHENALRYNHNLPGKFFRPLA